MKNKHYLLFILVILFSGCTKNNQNSPSQFAYLNVEQTYLVNSGVVHTYDIDNDGQVDWGFDFDAVGNHGYLPSYINSTSYVADYTLSDDIAKDLPNGFNINSTLFFSNPSVTCDLAYVDSSITTSRNFNIGFKSQNPSSTNTFYGWARVTLSPNPSGLGYFVIVRDMALNTVNGGSINVGQH
jgi:hypothetical protein